MDLKGRDFLALKDYSPEEITYLIDLAAQLKKLKKERKPHRLLEGYQAALIFEKTSTRTRCSFETAAFDLGMHTTYLNSSSSQLGKKESIADTARVLCRMYDGIEYRGFGQSKVETLAQYSSVPVWNGLTNEYHPTQMLADMLTIEEHVAKPLNKVKVVFVGDVRNNMAYAWMYGCAKMGMEFVAFGPKELAAEVDKDVLARAQKVAEETGASISVSSDESCLEGADVIYTDIWASMGEEDQIPERVRLLTPFKVTREFLDKTGNPDVIFMHCLPSFHDFDTTMAKDQKELGYDIREVTDEVFLSKNSVVFDEAENRMHTIKAVIVATIA